MPQFGTENFNHWLMMGVVAALFAALGFYYGRKVYYALYSGRIRIGYEGEAEKTHDRKVKPVDFWFAFVYAVLASALGIAGCAYFVYRLAAWK